MCHKNLLILLFLMFFAAVPKVFAQDEPSIGKSSGLPLPRFVSLANAETNVRTGPGQEYPVKWAYQRKGLPVEIILEFDNWRKIQDHEGQTGWVFHSLLSGERNALINSTSVVSVYEKKFDTPAQSSREKFQLEPSVQVQVKSCKNAWCEIHVSGFSGWIQRNLLWGVYESENID